MLLTASVLLAWLTHWFSLHVFSVVHCFWSDWWKCGCGNLTDIFPTAALLIYLFILTPPCVRIQFFCIIFRVSLTCWTYHCEADASLSCTAYFLLVFPVVPLYSCRYPFWGANSPTGLHFSFVSLRRGGQKKLSTLKKTPIFLQV